MIGTEPDLIAEKLAYYLGEINVIHPFREGNGRAQRVFIQYLAHTAGYHVDFTDVGSKEMIEASALAFDCDYRKMTALFQRITTTISRVEQAQFIQSIAAKGSPIQEAYDTVTQAQEQLQEEDETLHLT